MKKRVFIGIDLPEEIKKTFKDFFKKVGRLKEVKWEKPEKLHLTLVFLGFIEEEKIPFLAIILGSLVARVGKVGRRSLSLSLVPRLGGFPNLSNPRVLWLPVEGEVEVLSKIIESLKKLLKNQGFQFEKRPFSAHLTLGRFREGVRKAEKEKLLKIIVSQLPKTSFRFEVKGLTLFESKLTPRGSLYQVLAYENFGN